MVAKYRQLRERCGRNNKKISEVRWRFVALMFAMVAVQAVWFNAGTTQAESCPDLKVVFARGSGGERYTSGHYLAFRDALETKLKTTDLKYEFEDLDYSAVSIDVGDGHLGTLIGAYIGGGDAYEFGDSVKEGANELKNLINNSGCKNTKYVLGGYSQGAIVVLNALNDILPEKIVYVATFGDPKIYLPEGAGLVPVACSGRNLSDYRIYVPDCRAYKGIMGARDPYRLDSFAGKVGTWCNKRDILCSSHFSISDHTSYAEAGLYEDASRFIFSKIGGEFGITNQYTSPHDTAILIDSTDSMENLIADYKTEALRLAEKTLNEGGRVALYDYRDLSDKYTPVQRCSFETCTLETFKKGLEEIETFAGGDAPESLLSASFQVMKELDWNFGSTKSLVILTDDGYHSPDLDGTTFYDVQKLSKQIDPVNFYIITKAYKTELYISLAEATGGAVVSSVDDLGLLTDTIMERYDSLPRVEEEFEDEVYDNNLPKVRVIDARMLSETEVKIWFEKSGEAVAVFLDDGLIGTTYGNEITIGELKLDRENVVTLVPLSATRRGESVVVEVNGLSGQDGVDSDEIRYVEKFMDSMLIPKAPNTGRK